MFDTLKVLLLIELLGLVALPIAGAVLGRLPGGGLGFAKPLGLLLVAWLAWVVWALGVPNRWYLALGALAAMAVASTLIALRVKARARAGAEGHADAPLRRTLWLWAEGVFLAAFLAGALLSAFSPDVWGTEHPTDMMFVNAQLASTDFPPHDPWLAGEDLNYYYLGHYAAAWVIRLTGVAPDVGYNLAIALFFALAVTAAFALTAAVWAGARRSAGAPARHPVTAGLIGAGIATLLGNLAAFKELLGHDGPLRNYDWFSTTRVIPDTINDFPVFDWVLGDLHAHVMAVAFTFVGLAFAAQWALAGPLRRPSGAALGELAAMAVIIGSLYAINAWSYPVVLGVAVGGALTWAVGRERADWRLAAGAALALVAASLAAGLPHHLTFDRDIVRGIGRVTEHRGFGNFLRDLALTLGLQVFVVGAAFAARLRATAKPWRNLAWGTAAALLVGSILAQSDLAGIAVLTLAATAALAIALSAERPPAERFVWLLVSAGFACLLAPELVYVKDIFEGAQFYRLNTVFRFHYNAWLLLSVAAAVVLLWAPAWLPPRSVRVWTGAAALLVVASLSYTVVGTYARKAAFTDGPRLDGMEFLRALAPGDVAAIEWIRENTPGDAVVLESPGPVYSQFGHGRFSVFTGRPTVVQWSAHLVQFGQEPGNREAEVKGAYEDPEGTAARTLVSTYGIDYVVVGPIEQTDFGDRGIAKWDALGERVFERAGTTIWKVRAS